MLMVMKSQGGSVLGKLLERELRKMRSILRNYLKILTVSQNGVNINKVLKKPSKGVCMIGGGCLWAPYLKDGKIHVFGGNQEKYIIKRD